MKRSQPLLSILMPFYNGGVTIEDALLSVRELKIPYEVCIYDDGSDSVHWEKLFFHIEGHREIVTIRGEKNLGHIAKARNKTLALSRGKYVVVLDSDDMLVPDGIMAQIEFLEANETYGWCHAPAWVVKPDGTWTGSYLLSMPAKCAGGIRSWSHDSHYRIEQKLAVSVPEGEELFVENQKYSFINNWGCVIRRSLMQAVGGWSADLPGNGCGEDYDLNLKLARASKAKWISAISYKFTRDEEASAKKWNIVGGKNMGPFANYPFIQAKHAKFLPSPTPKENPFKERVREISAGQSPRALDIGCGPNWAPIPGYIVDRCDSRKETGANIVCDAEELNIDSETYDKVYASHVLEHFPRWKAPVVLREWLRVLKVGGEIEIRVPDILALAHNIIEGTSNDHDIHCQVFGAHTNACDEHHAFFTEKSLTQLMASLGVEAPITKRDMSNGPNLTWIGKKTKVLDDKPLFLKSTSVTTQVSVTEAKVPITMDFYPETAGSELTLCFRDVGDLHHFRWCCTLNGGIYNAALHLTRDIVSVKGMWRIDIWVAGLKIQTLEFEIVDKVPSIVDEALAGYLAEGP